MEYVVVFLAGAAAAASALIIWYFPYVASLRRSSLIARSREEQLRGDSSRLAQQALDLDTRKRQVEASIAAHEAKKVQYDDLVRENTSLKQDLLRLSVELKKTERDHAAIARRQEEISQRTNQLADRYLSENVSWIGGKVTANNFATSKQRLLKVIEACRDIGFQIPQEREQGLLEDLKRQYEQAVRDEFARQEQARIKAQIREEEKLAREIEKQIQDAQREQAAIQAALERALREAADEHSAEVEHLRAKLREAEEKSQRAMSRAQMTKSGHVYVISNIGSFGEGVFKIGMTRRLEPDERISELSSASVPFPYDVHMMVSCDDAPSLENALHRELHRQRLNKVNFRKEFFRVDLESIRKIVESSHGEVDYVAEPAALQYRETLSMTDEDYEFIEQTVQSVVGDGIGSLPEE